MLPLHFILILILTYLGMLGTDCGGICECQRHRLLQIDCHNNPLNFNRRFDSHGPPWLMLHRGGLSLAGNWLLGMRGRQRLFSSTITLSRSPVANPKQPNTAQRERHDLSNLPTHTNTTSKTMSEIGLARLRKR
ncbi:uncharacterized protein B0T23DRAFT_368769 [Neurospora hispaniola]|uniref:Secreted protein n=1 Tax=Neurospora hispaniola TaxID=588809 RepID=A0AAJ0IER0_9PEZI|nr:hypothetical protein B0T23DRAFT_368769 [Neurospora hispaniola]